MLTPAYSFSIERSNMYLSLAFALGGVDGEPEMCGIRLEGGTGAMCPCPKSCSKRLKIDIDEDSSGG